MLPKYSKGAKTRDLPSTSVETTRKTPDFIQHNGLQNFQRRKIHYFPKMSVLPPEVHTALASLLQGLSASDNQIRTHAEEQLNNEWISARPDVLLMGLVEQIQSAQEPSVWHLPSSLTTHTTHLADLAPMERLALSPQFSFVECQPRQGNRRARRSRKSCSCCYSRPKRWL